MPEQSTISDVIRYNSDFQFAVKHEIKNFKPGEMILSFGQKSTNFYYIKKGAVKIVVVEGHFKKNDVPHIVTNLSNDEIFGEFGLFDTLPISADVIAMVETEVIEIDKQSFLNFLETDVNLAYKICVEIIKTQSKRICHLNKTIYELFATQK